MDKLHPDAAALDRIGSQKLIDHFDITRQALYRWRTQGISRQFRKPVILLGETMKLDMSELKAPVGA